MRIPTTAIAAQLRTALHDGDTDVLTALLHPDVRFQPLDPAAATHGPSAAVAWYQDRRDRGIRTQVEELFAYPTSVVLGLQVTHPDTENPCHPALLYRLFRLRDDHVVHIRDFTDRTHALTTAETPYSHTG